MPPNHEKSGKWAKWFVIGLTKSATSCLPPPETNTSAWCRRLGMRVLILLVHPPIELLISICLESSCCISTWSQCGPYMISDGLIRKTNTFKMAVRCKNRRKGPHFTFNLNIPRSQFDAANPEQGTTICNNHLRWPRPTALCITNVET